MPRLREGLGEEVSISIATSGEHLVDLLDLKPEDVDEQKLALALGRVRWRFGATAITVAEHCVRAACVARYLADKHHVDHGRHEQHPVPERGGPQLVQRDAFVGGLLHDAEEAFTGDPPGPLTERLVVVLEEREV